jgi:preprotein translocase subunit SecY
MLSAFLNCFKIPELRQRILFTLGLLALVRLLTIVPCPGVDLVALKHNFQGSKGILDMVNLFSGGALEKFAVGALGIMPYISASIIMQILTPVLPDLERLQREGDHGRQKLNQYTRYLTVLICLIQGFILTQTMLNPHFLSSTGVSPVVQGLPIPAFTLTSVIILTGGTMIMMWLGEQITERGVGNGASLIISVNILDRLPSAISSLWKQYVNGTDLTAVHLVLIGLVFALACAGTIALCVGVRKIPIKHAGRIGGKVGQAQETYLPLRVNFSSVMPIIFASALLSLPPMLLGWTLQYQSSYPTWLYQALLWLNVNLNYGAPFQMAVDAALIIGFSYFWVANQFNPVRIADELQASGGYVPGLRPGQATAEYLDKVMTQITFAGALFLTVLALTPTILISQTSIFGSDQMLASFFGGTSLLIVVGVTLDTMKQVETMLMNHNYAGFLSKGQLRSRRG